MTRSRKRALVLLAVLGTGALVALAARPDPLRVELHPVRRGPLEVTVESDGRTRVRDRMQLLAPVSGYLERVTLRAGDTVRAGQVVARLRPLAAPLLDPRTRAEARARLSASEAARREALAGVERAAIARQRAGRDLERARALVKAGATARQQLEQAEFAEDLRVKEVRAAELAAETARHNVELARMTAALPESLRAAGGHLPVQAPAAGTVLRVLREHEGPVQAGSTLLELGDPAELELVLEVLTTEAVHVRVGNPVRVEGWGGEPLWGTVRLVEPSAFTKVSPLGVEEQRVNVIAQLGREALHGSRLADGYQVRATVIVEAAKGILQVPSASLFRHQTGWATFVVEKGRAVRRQVTPGRRGGRHTEVLAGLSEGEPVVLYPDDTLGEGVRVAAR